MIRLGLILGDQLNEDHAVLAALDRSHDHLLMGEVAHELTYVPHHRQKLVLILAAMRHRAAELEADGWKVFYQRADQAEATESFSELVERHCRQHEIEEVVVSWPGEWRVLAQIQQWEKALGVPVTVLPDSRFLTGPDEFERWAHGRKQLRMEYFYRELRKRTGYLMDGDKAVGEQWNYDSSNRKPWRGEPEAVQPMSFTPDEVTVELIDWVGNNFEGFGSLDGFDYPVTRGQARRALSHFIQRALPYFGDFQDAMDDDERYLFHSRLSSSLNVGLLDVREVCDAAEQAWRSGQAPLNAVEGFIRQIIGWREFVRGIYWLKMPEYAELNWLGHDQPLPGWYWTGKTDMRCLAKTVEQTIDTAYAHHIQRLMVTGNFALLLGVLPKEICDWYLAVYADAYDWVELPNTLGMVMHADGGLLASKPYAASGKYIQRMGNYCKNCRYQVSETVGDSACPFNAMYWDFLERHRNKLKGNPRMGMMYRNLDRMDSERRQAIADRATWIRKHIESV